MHYQGVKRGDDRDFSIKYSSGADRDDLEKFAAAQNNETIRIYW
jgi:hypothetical protein